MEIAARFELKYILSLAERDALLAHFPGRILPDILGGPSGHYPVVSLYCDSADRKCYWDAWRGVPSRRKLRLRLYGTKDGAIPAATFVEIKHRDGGAGAKRRVQLPLEQAIALANGEAATELTTADARILDEAQRLIAEEGFRPACVIRYDRHAYFLHLPEEVALGREPLRVTFDHDIAVRFDDLTPVVDDRKFNQYVLPADHCIMEVKGAGAVPYAFASRLSRLKLYPHQFSKYSEGLRVAGRHLAFAA